MPDMSPMDMMTKARMQLLQAAPVSGAMALYLTLVPTRTVERMATNGKAIFFNPDWVSTESLENLEGTIAHEAWHCGLGHFGRRNGRDFERWNASTDYVINHLIREQRLSLPQPHLYDPAYIGMSAEQVYIVTGPVPPPAPPPYDADDNNQDDTESGSSEGDGGDDGSSDDESDDATQATQDGAGSGQADSGTDLSDNADTASTAGQGNGSQEQSNPDWNFGEVIDGDEELSPVEEEALREEWRARTIECATIAAAQGHLPGSIKDVIDDLKNPEMDWAIRLKQFWSANVKRDSSWNRPNRRFVAQGIYLPSRHTKELDTVLILIDSSGSTAPYLQRFATELNAVAQDASPRKLVVIYVDMRVCHVSEYERGDEIDLTSYGGGGTDFRPGFRYAEEHGIEPVCAIYLTDLECYSYPEEPSYPVLWVSTQPGTAPFGETVRINS